MKKAQLLDRFLVAAPLLVVYACLVAGLYGALHDQISYTAAPEYFTRFKFHQFDIPAAWPDRLGAAWVGIQATWWMGFLIGLVLLIARPAFPDTRSFARAYLRSALVVVGVALLVGLGALAYAYLFFTPADVPRFISEWRAGLADPLAFWRVGHMHNYSYIGGALGALVGVSYLFWRGGREPRPHRKHHKLRP